MAMRADHAESQKLEVIVYPDRPVYSVAESIRPKLEIRNRHECPVQIAGGFECNWDRLAFTSPNAAHLFGPDGQDLMRPYQRPGSFKGYGPSIEAEAGKSEWLFLPISSHIH